MSDELSELIRKHKAMQESYDAANAQQKLEMLFMQAELRMAIIRWQQKVVADSIFAYEASLMPKVSVAI